MPFFTPIGSRPSRERVKNDPKLEDAFMQEHGGLGPRLTFLVLDAVFDLPSHIREIFGKRRRSPEQVAGTPFFNAVFRKTPESLAIYWMLARIMVPIAIVTEVLSRMGAITLVAPAFAPVMDLLGLPPELGLAWLTAMLVGIWGAVPLIFTLVPATSLSIADMTVFSALILFAHGLPIEQKIIQKAGPGMIVTTTLRIAGGLAYAFLLHHILVVTGWLSAPVNPAWIPIAATPDWSDYFRDLAQTMMWMLVILVGLSWGLDILKLSGLLDVMMTALSPLLRIAGIRGEARHLTAVGLFLGISYGAGLLIREARSGTISPRQIFLSCVLMGFAHSVIEDTLVVVTLGADVSAVLAGRLVFALAATAAIAALLDGLSDRIFFTRMFRNRRESGVKAEIKQALAQPETSKQAASVPVR